MTPFDEAALRLKQALGMTQDREVAAALGLSPTAWVGRKRRGTFPGTEVYALAAKRPELGLDVSYVLSGIPQRQVAQQLAAEPAAWLHTTDSPDDVLIASDEEDEFLSDWRDCTSADRALLRALAKRLAAKRASSCSSTPTKGGKQ